MKHDKENCPQTMLSHALSAEESDNTVTSNEPNMMALVLIFHLFKTYLLIKLTQISKESTAVIIDLKYPSFSTSFQCSKELYSVSEESIVLKELLQEWRVSKNSVNNLIRGVFLSSTCLMFKHLIFNLLLESEYCREGSQVTCARI